MQRAPNEVGWEIVDVAAPLRPQAGCLALQLPWETWVEIVQGKVVAVRSDARARHDPTQGVGSGYSW